MPERSLSNRYEIIPARSGVPTLRIGDLQMHSAYDPFREAEQAARNALKDVPEEAPVLIFGLGLGYLAVAVRKIHSGRLVVVEPDDQLVPIVRERRPDALDGLLVIPGLTPAETLEKARHLLGADPNETLHIVRHPPSVHLHQVWFGELERLLTASRRSVPARLNILVVTPLYGGSLPIARYCAAAFERLGHNVITSDNELFDPLRRRHEALVRDKSRRKHLTGLMTSLVADEMLTLAYERAVDLVWFVAQSPVTPAALAELKRLGIPTAFWFVEDWQLFTYWQEWAPLFSYFFTIQRGRLQEALATRGVRRSNYLPLAADPTIHRPLELSEDDRAIFGSDLSHVGAGYRNRRMLFSRFTGLDFKLWGNDWDGAGAVTPFLQRGGERLTTSDTVKVFNATRVNVNLHSSAFHDGVNPEGDFLNPRTFEIAACGGAQLIDQRQLLPDHFQPGRELVLFGNGDEMVSEVKALLNDPDRRKAIAEAGRQRVLAEHTYELRMAAALEFIFSYEDGPASHRHPDSVASFLKVAGDDDELRALLEPHRDAGAVTLEDVAGRILSQCAHRLSRAETTFLLMNEFRHWARDKDLA
ncbi:MAG: glycosyltransferase [Calditrichaeota bacterium]|nr:glycosyltransferase [Calditrichota bacterium]